MLSKLSAAGETTSARSAPSAAFPHEPAQVDDSLVMLYRRSTSTRLAILALSLSTCLVGLDAASQEPAVVRLIEHLGHDSYQTRAAAARSLRERANDANVKAKLIEALESESIEIRTSALSILRQFRFDAFDEQVQRLDDADCPADQITLPGWKRFVASAGNDRASRAVFQRIVQRFAGTLHSIQSQQELDHFDREFDPYRISGNESLRWAVLLMCDSEQVRHGVGNLSFRIINALSNSGLGPRCDSADEKTVLARLISHWIATHRSVATPREHLLVAMRFECFDQADEVCSLVFSDPNATPSSQATAMLVANVLRRSDADQQIRRRIDDDRTAHVWQLIASRKTKIRTQVRDVALALMLHRKGIDPRTIGFGELQADPLLVFRDHSLGFPDQEARRDAQARAREIFSE